MMINDYQSRVMNDYKTTEEIDKLLHSAKNVSTIEESYVILYIYHEFCFQVKIDTLAKILR